MKKLIYMSTLVLAALTINSCSSDDNSSSDDKTSLLVGKWEAATISYTYPGGTNSHAFSAIKEGCAVDVIELTKEKTGTVTVENKVNEACQSSLDIATWNEENKTIKVVGEDENRTIISVNDSELVLKYKMNYPKFGTTDVTVNFKRK